MVECIIITHNVLVIALCKTLYYDNVYKGLSSSLALGLSRLTMEFHYFLGGSVRPALVISRTADWLSLQFSIIQLAGDLLHTACHYLSVSTRLKSLPSADTAAHVLCLANAFTTLIRERLALESGITDFYNWEILRRGQNIEGPYICVKQMRLKNAQNVEGFSNYFFLLKCRSVTKWIGSLRNRP